MPAADPTAVLGRRFLAFVIDLIIATVIGIAVLVPAFNSRAETLPANEFQCAGAVDSSDFETDVTSDICIEWGDEVRFVPDDEAGSLSLIMYGVTGGWYILNSILLQAATGGTIGKLICGLRVVRQETGQLAGFGWLSLRALVGLIDVGCCVLIGGIMVLSTKGHRRLADMAAGTLVVSRTSVGQPPAVPGLNAGYGTPGYNAGYTQGWGGQQPQGTWAPPATGPGAPPPTGVGGVGASPLGQVESSSGEGPQWDEARNTYIQYDPNAGAWLQWDEIAGEWKPIDQ